MISMMIMMGLHQRHNPGQLLSRTFTKPERTTSEVALAVDTVVELLWQILAMFE